jgi:hypothetical protein
MDELLEASSEEFIIKAEGVSLFIGWLFSRGPRPTEVMKRLYLYARAARPELLLNMSGAEVAALFGQGRAAESHRERLVLGETLSAVGSKASFGWQKSPASCARYAAIAKGNRNRSKGKKAA